MARRGRRVGVPATFLRSRIAWRYRWRVRTTVTLHTDLFASAQAPTDESETSAAITQALRALARHESARRLARLEGSHRHARGAARRRGG